MCRLKLQIEKPPNFDSHKNVLALPWDATSNEKKSYFKEISRFLAGIDNMTSPERSKTWLYGKIS